jgi:hypothetical protein
MKTQLDRPPDEEMFEETWDVDFEPEEVEEVECLAKLGVNANLAECVLTIAKTASDQFMAWWEERHPELGTFDEHFGGDRLPWDPTFAKRTDQRVREWTRLRELLPSKCYAVQISRREAFEIIATFFLPEEFHEDAGLED